jgi:pimeloyl-ACP methyl ester carboxylesterase
MTPGARNRLSVWLGRAGLAVAGLLILLVAGGAGYEAWARHQAHVAFPPRGQLVDIGGRRIHLDCRGRGSPTVVLQAGLDTYGSLAWSAVHDRIAAVTRTCAYDRAGVMWSDPSSGVHDADAVSRDLHAALSAAGEKAPFVLVAHSLGGPYAVDYTRRYGGQVAGLVFVDASHPDQNRRLKAAHFTQMVKPVSPVAKAMAGLTWLGWTRLSNEVPDMPNFPPRAAAAAGAYAGVSLPAVMAEQAAIDQTLAEAGAGRALGARPLVVLTAMQPLPAEVLKSVGMTPADGARMQAIWKALQDDEASWSSRSRHQIVPDSTHYIQFFRPDIVVSAVEEVVGEARSGERLPGQRPSPSSKRR